MTAALLALRPRTNPLRLVHAVHTLGPSTKQLFVEGTRVRDRRDGRTGTVAGITFQVGATPLSMSVRWDGQPSTLPPTSLLLVNAEALP